MKQCIALAGVVCLALSGCAQSGFLAGKGRRPVHVARSITAPRPDSPRIARMADRSNIIGVTQAQYDETMVYEDPMAYPDAGTGYLGSRDVGGCDDVCCGDGCVDGLCADGCCGAGCGGKSMGQRLGETCACMRAGYGRWDCRAWTFVNGVASGFCPHHGGYPEATRFNYGPPTGHVAYPYYTVRGPRDFLQDEPTSIGPY